MKYLKILDEIEKKYKEKIITRKEIESIINKIYKIKNEKTIRNILGILKQNHVITEIKKDNYVVVSKEIYQYKETKETIKIYKTIETEYPEIKFIVWNTEMLNEFTLHYAVNNYIIVEVEKVALDLVINLLKEKYLNKYTVVTQNILTNNREFFFNTEKLLIVKPLIVKSPIENIKNKKYITIEKIMVDLYIDKLYIQYQGKELQTIYENIFDKYDVNMKKIIKYAELRTDINSYKKYINKLNIPEKYKLKEDKC